MAADQSHIFLFFTWKITMISLDRFFSQNLLVQRPSQDLSKPRVPELSWGAQGMP